MWPCSADAAAILSEGLAAACIQATAAEYAGRMTLVAGMLAFGVACLGTGLSIYAIRSQEKTAKDLHDNAQKHAARRDVYLQATTGLYTGLMAMSRILDLKVKVSDTMAQFHAEAPKIAQVHMVGPLNVVRAVIRATTTLSMAHLDLIYHRRIFQERESVPTFKDYAEWCADRMAIMDTVRPALTAAVLAMREDIDLTIDATAYGREMEKLVRISVTMLDEALSNFNLPDLPLPDWKGDNSA